MTRLNWSSRSSPTDLDIPPDKTVSYEFDHRRCTEPGKSSWPEKFGPSTITKALKSGLIVCAEIEGFPYPVAIKQARWSGQTLEVITLEGPRVAQRIFTRPDAKGLTVGGVLMEE